MVGEEAKRNRKDAEADINAGVDTGGPFVIAVQGTRMPTVISDPNLPGNPIIRKCQFSRAYRTPAGGGAWTILSLYDGPETDPEAQAKIEHAFEHGFDAAYPETLYKRKNGETFWAIIFVGPVVDGNCTIVQHCASFLYVIRRRQDEERMRAMLDKLDHRLKVDRGPAAYVPAALIS
ncbi:hypothetical protein V6617_02105 [Pelagibacterium nitratireducens]|uniref:PAC domain-containing protein n=1 Tax=Pelagibacterium nitratireducens TaxID=1046114 RepID=A0ABZ2I1S7_9HYPH